MFSLVLLLFSLSLLLFQSPTSTAENLIILPAYIPDIESPEIGFGLIQSFSLAISDVINSSWWPIGWNLTGIWKDTECREDIAMGRYVETYEEWSDKIVVTIGPECASVAESVSALAEYYQIPILSSAASSAVLSDREQFPYFYRIIGSGAGQVAGWVQLCQHYNWSKIAVLYGSQDDDSQILALQFKEKANAGGIQVPFFQRITNQQTELSNQIDKLEQSLLSVILLIGSPSEAKAIFSLASQYNLTGVGAVWLGNDNWQNTEFWDGDESIFEAAKGALGFRLYSGSGPAFDRLVANVSSSLPPNSTLDPRLAYTYDAVVSIAQTISQLIKKGKNPFDRQLFLQTYLKIETTGLTGEISFDPKTFERAHVSFDLINLRDSGWEVIGNWSLNQPLQLSSSPIFSGQSQTAPPNDREAEKVLRLYGLFPFTGSWPVGEYFYAAFELAVMDSQSMMPSGWKVEPFQADAQCAGGPGIQSMIEAHDGGAVGAVGSVCSVSSTPATQLGAAWEIPMISPGSTSLSLSDKTTYPFFRRVISPDSVQAYNWIDFCLRYNWKRVGVIYSQEDIHTKTANLFISQAFQYGIQIEAQSFPTGGPYDFQLQSIKNKRMSIIVLSCYGDPDAQLLLPRAQQLGLVGPDYAWLGTDSWNYDQFWYGAPDYAPIIAAAEGSTTISASPGSGPVYERMLAYLNSSRGLTDPPTRVGYAYDSVLVYVGAFNTMIARGEDPRTNGTRLLEVIQNTTVPGNITVTGYIEFNEVGDRDQTFLVMSMSKGKLIVFDTWARGQGFGTHAPPLWIGGKAPPDVAPQEAFQRNQSILDAVFAITIILSVLVLMVVGVWVRYKDHKMVKISSQTFSFLILFGVLMYYGSVFALYGDLSDASCLVSLWLDKIAYCIVFGCLFIKTYRLWRVFDNSSLVTLHLNDSILARYLSVIVGIAAIYLIIWSAIDPVFARTKTDPADEGIAWTVCESEHSGWALGAIVVQLTFLFWGVFLAWKVRNIPLEANEAAMIAYSIYNIFIVKIVVFPIIRTTGPDPDGLYVLYALDSLWSGTAVVIFNFLPRFYYIWFSPTSSTSGKTRK